MAGGRFAIKSKKEPKIHNPHSLVRIVKRVKKMSNKSKHFLYKTCTVLAVLGLSVLTGCQSQIGGQTLPSPHYLTDDVQYFAPTGEMKLQREAAVMQEYQAQREAASN